MNWNEIKTIFYKIKSYIRYNIFRYNNTKSCQRFVKKYMNTIVYTLRDELAILEGFHIGDDDLYYITRDINGELHYQTCVGYCIALKGKIDKDAYRYLKSRFQHASDIRYEQMMFLNQERNKEALAKLNKE